MTKIEFFANTFLFRNIPCEKIEALIKDAVIERCFERGELIYACDSFEKMLGFVFEGECEVVSKNSRVPLNILLPYSSFGITAIYSPENEFPTNVYAKRSSVVYFISRDSLMKMISESADISYNIIAFLIGRISFLNKKIATFSGENVECKLAAYLLNLYKRIGDSFDLNLKHTAEEINAGRASLYRALSSLETDGVIKRNGKNIIIIDPKGLERIPKQ